MSNTFLRNDGTFAAIAAADVSGISTGGASLTSVTDFTTADVSISSSTGSFTTGPFVTQGSSGTWFASGAVTFTNTAGAVLVYAKLWDGTSVIASGSNRINAVNTPAQIALSGVITSPSSNIQISASSNGASTVMKFNFTGASADSNVTAVRIA